MLSRCLIMILVSLNFAMNLNAQETGTFTDSRDGIIYKTVVIGGQTWMAENLRATSYANGDSIPKVSENNEWSNLSTGACCDYDNIADNSTKYAKLYNWYAIADTRNLCPAGWHVPSESEWKELGERIGAPVSPEVT